MNYYEILGVSENASQDEIKRKYRELAKKYHPDISGNKNNEEKFKEITEAYNILGNQSEREKYDHSRKFTSNKTNINFNDFFVDSIFSSIFKDSQFHGVDVRRKISIPLRDLVLGKTVKIKVRGEEREIMIDPSVESGETFLIKGGGEAGQYGFGDMHLTVIIIPDPLYAKKGIDLYIEKDVKLKDFLLGSNLKFTHIDGKEKKVKLNTNKIINTTLKVKGHGAHTQNKKGDLYIKLNIEVPNISNKIRKVIEEEF